MIGEYAQFDYEAVIDGRTEKMPISIYGRHSMVQYLKPDTDFRVLQDAINFL